MAERQVPSLSVAADDLSSVSVGGSATHESAAVIPSTAEIAVADSATDGDVNGAHTVDESTDASTTGAAESMDARSQPRAVRGRYAKFSASMDVVMLEALLAHNPFTAKHGTRLEMWRRIAETVGEETIKDRNAYSWHTCRDRVTTLINLYADNKTDKLFKHGSIEENARKETLLQELHVQLHRKGAKPGANVRAPTLLEARLTHTPPLLATTEGSVTDASSSGVALHSSGGSGAARLSAGRAGNHGAQKRRRVEAAARNLENGATDTETFRAKVLELMETKIHFDMEQRAKENELREHEFELQKRFLEYLQSK